MTAHSGTYFLTLFLLMSTSPEVLSSPVEGDVRLEGADNTALQGRVEIYHDGAWLSVCDASWDTRKGDVVCRQLGFSGGAMSTDRSALFGQGRAGSWLTDVTCTGSEDSLLECTGLTYGVGTCSHVNDAGVRCAYPMYQGCYSSSATGPLTSFSTESDAIDIALCLDICRNGGHTFAGMAKGRRCSCGNSLSGGGRQGNSGCNMACAGDMDEICGGSATASIYRTENSYSDGVNGGYETSPNFPKPYTSGDSFDNTIAIPAAFNYAVVSFSYFKLATGDSVRLQAAGATVGTYGSSDAVRDTWISMSASTSFDVSFAVGGSSPGDTGFALLYRFGKLCFPADLPSNVPYGSYNSQAQRYYYGEEVDVTCQAGYQRDKEAFVCQLDGTWSQAPACLPIPTTLPPTAPSNSTQSTTVVPGTTASETPSGDSATTAPGPVVPPISTALTTTDAQPCTVPEVANGQVDSLNRVRVLEGDMITLTCDDSYVPENDYNATCLASGEFDVALSCTPTGALPPWLIAIIVVAAVLALIVVVLIILLMLVSNEPKRNTRPGQRRTQPRDGYSAHAQRESPVEDRLVAIAPSVQQNASAASSIISGSDDGGTVNQGAQTDADPALGDIGDPMVGDSDVYHPTRDYPGAGAGRRPPSLVPMRQAPMSPPPLSATSQLPRQRSMDFRPNQADFSMLENDEMLAVRALDNVVSDFERDQAAYYLGPSGPSPYGIDRGSRYGSRQVQFSQRSRLSSFWGLY
ncbi:uncharacterized protein LOC119728725 [Patiria miniata]|uniref:Uncharacterized protein n=1 Tax=Patiria miniata TaxID=46514 RepID=A0A913ZZX0_PATMI|nr:uncharacterized protein LOC119728725 [Patiria miniata]